MRIVLQRVSRASVDVQSEWDTEMVGQIAQGLVLFLGIAHGDTEADADRLIEKVIKLRVFANDGGESAFDANVQDVQGGVLIVSQFTLYGDCSKGTRPSFTQAAQPEEARRLYDYFVQKMIATGLHTETGRFAAHMEVSLVNDGPVTLILDSK